LGHRHKDSSRFKKTKSRQRWKWHKKKMRKNAKYKRYMKKRSM